MQEIFESTILKQKLQSSRFFYFKIENDLMFLEHCICHNITIENAVDFFSTN